MSRNGLRKHLEERLAVAEEDLKRLKTAIAQHNLRVLERDVNGQRDVTEVHLKDAEGACEEYRRLMSWWFPDEKTR